MVKDLGEPVEIRCKKIGLMHVSALRMFNNVLQFLFRNISMPI